VNCGMDGMNMSGVMNECECETMIMC
jgi:hypothetical protein